MAALARPLSRSTSWRSLVASGALSAVLVWWFEQEGAGAGDAALALRFAAVCLGGALAFALEDPTEDTTAMTPVSLTARRTLRVALIVPVAAIVWLVLLRYAGGATGEALPLWPFVLEPAALWAAAVAGWAVGTRYLADRMGGMVGAAVPLLVGTVVSFGPGGARLWALMPGTAGYPDGSRWWGFVVAVAALVFLAASAVGRPHPIGIRRGRHA